MSGKIVSFARKGSLAERIADLWLSMIGVCTPVRREDDYGVDFHCELGDEHEGNYVSFHSPFILQVKTSLDGGVRYGERQPGKWKHESVAWLFQNKIPFFIGVVDVPTLEFRIYDTTGLWQVYNHAGNWASQILLVARDHPDGEMRDNVERAPLEDWEDGKGDGYRYVVDLGNPVLVFSWGEVENEGKMKLKKGHLTNLIHLEQKNITGRDLGMRVFTEVKANARGGHIFTTGMSFAPHPYLNPDRVMEEFYPWMVSLLIKYKDEGREVECAALKEYLRYARPSRLDKMLYYSDKELFGYLKERVDGDKID